MKFECPHCKQHMDAGGSLAGSQIQCPSCNKDIMIPASAAPAAALQPESSPIPLPAPSGQPGSGIRENSGSDRIPSPESSPIPLQGASVALRGAMTIPQFLASQHIQGGVQLDSPEDVSGQETEASAAAALLQGADERYEEAEVIGEGGMGVVVKARDRNLRCTVAMKVMREPQKAGKEQILRFIEEAQVTAQLAHPSIVPVHDLALDSQGNAYYTMKFAQGKTLKDVLNAIRDGDARAIEEYTLPRLLGIFQKVCDAIAFAHSKRVIHRDLKPENVMVGEYGEVLVMDWGLAKILPKKVVRRLRTRGSAVHGLRTPPVSGNQNPVSSDQNVESVRGEVGKTMAGSIMGTPGYMAPEQAMGEIDKLDERTDIYSLGAILYTILTLRVSITGRTIPEILNKISTGQITPPTAFNVTARARKQPTQNKTPTPNDSETLITLAHCPNQRVPESLSAVTMKALATKQDDRYVEVKSLQKEIENYQMGFATAAEEASAWKQFTLLIARHKGISVSVVAALVVVAVLTAGFVARVAREKELALKERDRAEAALASYKEEQVQRQADRKASAPALVDAARALAEKRQFKSALGSIRSAVEYDPGLPEARLIHALLLIQARDYAQASEQAAVYRRLCPGEQAGKIVEVVAQQGARQGPASTAEGELLVVASKLEMPMLGAEFSRRLESQFPLYQAKLAKAWPSAGTYLSIAPDRTLTLNLGGRKDLVDLSPLLGMPLNTLTVAGSRVSDLTPLKGMPLTSLDLQGTPVSDLTPLKGMPLTALKIEGTMVTDLSPLKGMSLTSLNARHARIGDLGPLRGMPLTKLYVDQTEVRDLTPLRGMNLTTLYLTPQRITNGFEVIRAMKTLITISAGQGEMPATDFWKLYDAGGFKGK